MTPLMRWEPFQELQREMRRLQREMDRIFGRWGFELPTAALPFAAAYPPVNVWEDEEFVYAEAELPGVSMDNLEITVTGTNQLTIKGERKPTGPEKAEWHRRERAFGAFERILELPVPVDPAKVEARLENGVLTIKMAKGAEARPRKIVVKAE
ncbi:MAG: Hsp20/alpha crystallin family protein [Gemmatales bacterium]|nr:Hsp20/alpha crystallin family protein [Gemmatales bacterium]MDW8385888.1 Hsp20/alpha crystallin family protein [Gemmatales bacterium]